MPTAGVEAPADWGFVLAFSDNACQGVPGKDWNRRRDFSSITSIAAAPVLVGVPDVAPLVHLKFVAPIAIELVTLRMGNRPGASAGEVLPVPGTADAGTAMLRATPGKARRSPSVPFRMTLVDVADLYPYQAVADPAHTVRELMVTLHGTDGTSHVTDSVFPFMGPHPTCGQ